MAPTAEDTAVRRQGFAGAARRDARNVGRGFKAGKVGRVSNGQVVTGCAWKSGNVFERDGAMTKNNGGKTPDVLHSRVVDVAGQVSLISLFEYLVNTRKNNIMKIIGYGPSTTVGVAIAASLRQLA